MSSNCVSDQFHKNGKLNNMQPNTKPHDASEALPRRLNLDHRLAQFRPNPSLYDPPQPDDPPKVIRRQKLLRFLQQEHNQEKAFFRFVLVILLAVWFTAFCISYERPWVGADVHHSFVKRFGWELMQPQFEIVGLMELDSVLASASVSGTSHNDDRISIHDVVSTDTFWDWFHGYSSAVLQDGDIYQGTSFIVGGISLAQWRSDGSHTHVMFRTNTSLPQLSDEVDLLSCRDLSRVQRSEACAPWIDASTRKLEASFVLFTPSVGTISILRAVFDRGHEHVLSSTTWHADQAGSVGGFACLFLILYLVDLSVLFLWEVIGRDERMDEVEFVKNYPGLFFKVIDVCTWITGVIVFCVDRFYLRGAFSKYLENANTWLEDGSVFDPTQFNIFIQESSHRAADAQGRRLLEFEKMNE